MGKRIVLQNEIDQQYQKFNSLTKSFYKQAKDISFRLSLVSGAYKRSGGQTTIVMTCRIQSRWLLDVAETLNIGAEFMRISRDTLRNLDATIRQEIKNKDIPSLEKLAIGDMSSDARVVTEEEYYLISTYESKEQLPYDPNTEKDLGWCAGYAYARFRYLYPNTKINTGNANVWLDSNSYNQDVNVVRGDWSSMKGLKVPCVAVGLNGNYGHVLIIEGITYNEDGSIKDIYWSESNGEYDTNNHNKADYIDYSSSFFTEGCDGVMNKYTVGSGEMPSVLRNIAGFIVPV